jgi:hypothetical protein
MAEGILVINAGSTSVKFAAYRSSGAGSPDLVCRGQVEGIGSQPSFVVKDSNGKPVGTHDWEKMYPLDPEDALKFVISWIETHQTDLKIAAVGHRVVHGGLAYDGPVLVDEKVISELEKLEAVEPSHQPFEVDAIGAVARASQAPAGCGVRHVVSPDHAPAGPALRAARGVRKGRDTTLGLSRHFVRLHFPRAAALRTDCPTRDRRSSGGRCQHVRHARRQKHGHVDGL